MAGNNSIQILRASSTYDINQVELLDGQPFYYKGNKQLYVGDDDIQTELKPVGAANLVPGTNGIYSVMQLGMNNESLGDGSFATGIGVKAKANCSHAQNNGTTANGENSTATGFKTYAMGTNSFTAGEYTIANQKNQFVIGKYNLNKPNNIFEIGNGKEDKNSNLFEVYYNSDDDQGIRCMGDIHGNNLNVNDIHGNNLNISNEISANYMVANDIHTNNLHIYSESDTNKINPIRLYTTYSSNDQGTNSLCVLNSKGNPGILTCGTLNMYGSATIKNGNIIITKTKKDGINSGQVILSLMTNSDASIKNERLYLRNRSNDGFADLDCANLEVHGQLGINDTKIVSDTSNGTIIKNIHPIDFPSSNYEFNFRDNCSGLEDLKATQTIGFINFNGSGNLPHSQWCKGIYFNSGSDKGIIASGSSGSFLSGFYNASDLSGRGSWITTRIEYDGSKTITFKQTTLYGDTYEIAKDGSGNNMNATMTIQFFN